jgi:gamma-glutamyltranspeptidase/glutathione hydrolase
LTVARPGAGEIFRNPAQARTLEELALTRCESLYRGDLAQHWMRIRGQRAAICAPRILSITARSGSSPSTSIIAAWMSGNPPSGQGLVALMALKILEASTSTTVTANRPGTASCRSDEAGLQRWLHYITDPLHMRVAVADLLSDGYSARRRAQIGDQAQPPKPGDPHADGTVYLATADGQGNMVSFIQSNYHGFGSGVVLPDSGIALQNRGQEFSLDPEHANALAPGKKTFHTIIPGFLTRMARRWGRLA